MAETPIPITTGTGQASVAADLVSGNSYQQIKVVDGTIGGNTPLKINADGSITASIYGSISVTPAANQSVSGTIGASIIGTVPVTFVNSSISGTVLVSGLQGASVSGTVGASVLGAVNIQFSQNVQGSDTDGSSQLNIPVGPITATHAPMGVAGYVYNGASWDRVRGSASIGTLVTPYTFPSSLISGVTSVITGTASVQVLAPPATGTRNYVTNLLVTNAAAVGTTVQLFDGGNVIYAGYAAASGGGFAVSFPAPLKQSSIAGNLSALSTVQASVFVSASGYTAA